MMNDIPDKDFLEYIVKALVDYPEDVKIERKVDEMGVLLSLRINPKDMGQIIGRAGATAKSIRNLVRIIGLKNQSRVNLKIEEPAEREEPIEREEKKEEEKEEKEEKEERTPIDSLDELTL